MPCDSSHLEPTGQEDDSLALCKLLDEVGIKQEAYDRNYGRVKTLDRDTAYMCDWCKAHPDRIASQSLELQIWWRDHQIADAKKAERQKRTQELRRTQQQALDKLTDEEVRALGIRIKDTDDGE